MKSFTAVLLAAAALASARAVSPKFSQEWSATTTSSIAIDEGGSTESDGNICCPPESPECKVQTGFQGGMQYFSVAQNATAFKTEQGGIVTLFNLGKEFQVDSSGACQAWCPAPHHMAKWDLENLNQGVNNTDNGPSTYDGTACELYTNTQRPFFNITFQTNNAYVVLASSPDTFSTPLATVQLITPFGQQLGKQTQQFINYKSGPIDPSEFTVTGISTCPKGKCGGDGSSSSGSWDPEDITRDLVERIASEGTQSDVAALFAAMYKPPGYDRPSYLYPHPGKTMDSIEL